MTIGNKLKVAKNVVTSTAGRQVLKGQKNAPAILFGAGVIGFGVTVVLASKATLKLSDVLEAHENEQNNAHDLHELGRLGKADYTTKQFKRDSATMKLALCKDLAKLYAPATAVGVLSIGALTGSHVVLNRRYTGAVAAYSALDKSFREYQERVKELAPELDQKKLLNGSETREIVSEDGSEVKTVEESRGLSPYAKLFSSQTSTSWSPQPEYNLITLRAQQAYANDKLRTRGHVLLNDVYDALGMDRTKAGALVGWVKDNPRGGDSYIDFGVFDNPDRFHEFMTTRDGALWLDFNVDGIVYDLI